MHSSGDLATAHNEFLFELRHADKRTCPSNARPRSLKAHIGPPEASLERLNNSVALSERYSIPAQSALYCSRAEERGYANQLLVMQPDGSQPSSDRLKTFTLNSLSYQAPLAQTCLPRPDHFWHPLHQGRMLWASHGPHELRALPQEKAILHLNALDLKLGNDMFHLAAITCKTNALAVSLVVLTTRATPSRKVRLQSGMAKASNTNRSSGASFLAPSR
eukprot:892142-Pleurochrysis_carterae.AAC.7